MNLLAHNGVDHITEFEGAAHGDGGSMLLIALVSAVFVGIITSTIYLMQKRAAQKVINSSSEGNE